MTEVVVFPSKDCSILKFTPEINYCSESELYVGRFTNEETLYRTLMYFDLATISKTSMIKKAILYLFVQRNEILEGKSIHFQAETLNDSFQEDKVCWSNQPELSGDSYSICDLKHEYTGIIKLDITYAVRGWIHGWFNNNGFIITGDEYNNSLISICSGKHFNSDLRPRLVIDYRNDLNNYYPEETLNLKNHETKYSQIIPLTGTDAVSFFVTTDNEITATLQVSCDDINYINIYFSYISLSNGAVLNTNVPCSSARIEFTSSDEDTVIKVAPVIRSV